MTEHPVFETMRRRSKLLKRLPIYIAIGWLFLGLIAFIISLLR